MQSPRPFPPSPPRVFCEKQELTSTHLRSSYLHALVSPFPSSHHSFRGPYTDGSLLTLGFCIPGTLVVQVQSQVLATSSNTLVSIHALHLSDVENMAQAGVRARLQQGHLPRTITIPTELSTMPLCLHAGIPVGCPGRGHPRVGPPGLGKQIC